MNTFHTLENRLSSNHLTRIKNILPEHKAHLLGRLTNILSNFHKDHLFYELTRALDFSEGKTRHSGEDNASHYLGVGLSELTKDNFQLPFMPRQVIGGVSHDTDEDLVNVIVKEQTKVLSGEIEIEINELYKLQKRRIKSSGSLKKIEKLKNSIEEKKNHILRTVCFERNALMDQFRKNHNLIASNYNRTESNLLFLDGINNDHHNLTRHSSMNEDYATYITRGYDFGTTHSEAIKFKDVKKNGQTLWMSKKLIKTDLSIAHLLDKKKFLRNASDTTVARRLRKEFENQFEMFNHLTIKSNDWKLKIIEKAFIHIYMGKQVLLSSGHSNTDSRFYSEVLKPAHKGMLIETYKNVVRLRTYLSVHDPNLSVEKCRQLEQGWLNYMGQGLDTIDMTNNQERRIYPINNHNRFAGTIERMVDEMMATDMLTRFIKSPERNLSSEEIYARLLVYESSLQQNLKGVEYPENFNPLDLKSFENKRNNKFYRRNRTRQVRINYEPKNFREMIYSKVKQ